MSANESDVELFDFKQVQRIVSGYGIKAYTAQEKFCNNKWDTFHGPMHNYISFSYNAYTPAAHSWLPPGSFNIGYSNGKLVGHMRS